MKKLFVILKILIDFSSFFSISCLWYFFILKLYEASTNDYFELIKGDTLPRNYIFFFLTITFPFFLFCSWKILKKLFKQKSFLTHIFLLIASFLLFFAFPFLILAFGYLIILAQY